jgi:hypothetical protein
MSDFDKDRPRRIRAWRSRDLYLPSSRQNPSAAKQDEESEKSAGDGGGGVVNKLTGGKRAEG